MLEQLHLGAGAHLGASCIGRLGKGAHCEYDVCRATLTTEIEIEIEISTTVGLGSAVPGVNGAVLGTLLAAAVTSTVASALGERVLRSLEAPIARQESLSTRVVICRPSGAKGVLRAAGGRVTRSR